MAKWPNVVGYDTVTFTVNGEEVVRPRLLIKGVVIAGTRIDVKEVGLLANDGVEMEDLRDIMPIGTVLEGHKIVKQVVKSYTFIGDSGEEITAQHRWGVLDTTDTMATAKYASDVKRVIEGDISLEITRKKVNDTKPAPSSDISASDEEVDEQDTIDPITGEIDEESPFEEKATAKAKK